MWLPMADSVPAAAPLSETSLRDEIQSRALKLLTTREHSRLELSRKLRHRGYPAPEVDAVLDALMATGLLSEERLVSAYVTERLAKGFGPVRIRFELREKGLSDDQIQPYLELEEEKLLEYLRLAYQKRFAEEERCDRREQAKRSRFLEYRGFPPGLIARFLSTRSC